MLESGVLVGKLPLSSTARSAVVNRVPNKVILWVGDREPGHLDRLVINSVSLNTHWPFALREHIKWSHHSHCLKFLISDSLAWLLHICWINSLNPHFVMRARSCLGIVNFLSWSLFSSICSIHMVLTVHEVSTQIDVLAHICRILGGHNVNFRRSRSSLCSGSWVWLSVV